MKQISHFNIECPGAWMRMAVSKTLFIAKAATQERMRKVQEK
jgi:hypothetical protein